MMFLAGVKNALASGAFVMYWDPMGFGNGDSNGDSPL